MDNQTITEFIAGYPIKVIPLDLYCRVFGDTEAAIKKRLNTQQWKLGQEVLCPKGQRKRWVNLRAVEKWVLKASSQNHSKNKD